MSEISSLGTIQPCATDTGTTPGFREPLEAENRLETTVLTYHHHHTERYTYAYVYKLKYSTEVFCYFFTKVISSTVLE